MNCVFTWQAPFPCWQHDHVTIIVRMFTIIVIIIPTISKPLHRGTPCWTLRPVLLIGLCLAPSALLVLGS